MIQPPLQSPVLLLDVMDTLVRDPFYEDVPRAFGMELRELIKVKDPAAWPEFERGHIGEHDLYRRFFTDRRHIDGPKLKETLRSGYQWLPGIPELLSKLWDRGVEMHVLSNYPTWYRMIEAKLNLSRWVRWSFVSCHTGVRKPEAEAFLGAARALGRPTHSLIFVDDREANCQAAKDLGLTSIKFEGAPALESTLESALESLC